MARRSDKSKAAKTVCGALLEHGPAVLGNADVLKAIFPSFPAEGEPAEKRLKQSPAKATQADITRAIKASVKAGMSVSGTEIAADGTIKVLHADAAEGGSSQYDRWKARRDARPS